jgi:hypothetical protein
VSLKRPQSKDNTFALYCFKTLLINTLYCITLTRSFSVRNMLALLYSMYVSCTWTFQQHLKYMYSVHDRSYSIKPSVKCLAGKWPPTVSADSGKRNWVVTLPAFSCSSREHSYTTFSSTLKMNQLGSSSQGGGMGRRECY